MEYLVLNFFSLSITKSGRFFSFMRGWHGSQPHHSPLGFSPSTHDSWLTGGNKM
jgi:hypothetical protein|eukprot:COSAG06_NODE_1557_length_9112_cov_2.163763_4_plen_54_part_00